MGIITKNDDKKKNVSVMVRIPKNIANIIDTCVGNTHSSRPDFVIDGIRAFSRYISDCEKEILDYIEEKKDASQDVKIAFYRESIKSQTQSFRDEINAADRSEKDVDVLLSLPSKLALEIDLIVDRTGCFRNRQEYIKASTVYLSVRLGSVSKITMASNDLLNGNKSTRELREKLERMKERTVKSRNDDER